MTATLLRQNLLALAGCGLLGLLVAVGLTVDRAAPIRFIEGRIVPEVVAPGQIVAVRWRDVWTRHCQATLSRELVGADEVVRAYRAHALRIPARLGEQVSETPFKIPHYMPSGPATYRGILRFDDCGLTARWWPLIVPVPPLHFAVQ